MTQTRPVPKIAPGPRGRHGPAGHRRGPGRPVGLGGVPWLLGLPSEFSPRLVGRYRAWMIVRGLAGLVLGGLILFQPALSLAAFALVIGIFLILAGIVRIVIGAVDSEFTAGVRVLNVILGVLLAAIGAVAIRYPGFGLVATVVLVGFAWMMEGGASLALLPPRHQGRAWAVAFAVVSLIGGAMLIMWPVAALVPLFIVAGAFLAVGGLFDLINAVTLKASR